jgi:hypothetical protein
MHTPNPPRSTASEQFTNASAWPVAAAAIVVALLFALVTHGQPSPSPSPPLSAGDVTNARGRPVAASEEAIFGQAVTTSPVNVGGASGGSGWAEATFDSRFVQNIRVVNTHSSQAVCLRTVARASSAVTCDATCTGLGAGALTCTGSGAADGTYLAAGSPPFVTSITGEDCLCAEASASSTGVQATRVQRYPD